MTTSASHQDPFHEATKPRGPSAEQRLVQTCTGRAYLSDHGQLAAVPDAATWRALRRSGLDVEKVDTIPDDGGEVPVASLERSALFYVEYPPDQRRTCYLNAGQLFDVSDIPADVIAKCFGEPLPINVVFPDAAELVASLPSTVLATTDNWLAIMAYLRTIPPPAVTEAPGLTITAGAGSPRRYTGPANVAYDVTVQQQQVKNVLDTFPVVSPVTDAIWPGSLVQGASLSSGLLAPVQIDDRASGILTVTTELVSANPGAPTSATVDQPSLSSVTTTRQQLLRGLAPNASTGRVSLELSTITTEQQVSARLGANVSGSGWNASADVSISGSLETSRSMLKLTQEFYTVAFEPSGSPAHYFGDAVGVDAVRQYSGVANAPCYIHQVTYGRIFLFSIDSSDTAVTVDANVKAAWKATVSGDVSAQEKLKDTTKSYSVQLAAVGVSGATAFRAAGGLVEALKALADKADYSEENPGAVISYSARYLLDGTIATAVVGPYTYQALVRAEQPSTTSSYTVADGPGGVQGGKATGLTLRPGDTVSVTAFGHVWAGWWFGSWFGPPGDTSERGKSIGNGTKPLTGVAFSGLIYGFGQGWFYWDDHHEFIYGQTRIGDNSSQVIGSATMALPMYVHINDDNVTNGKGGFSGQIAVLRRPLAAVGPV